MRNEAFAEKALTLGTTVCIAALFIANIVFFFLDNANPFNFGILTIPFMVLSSSVGIIAGLGLVALKVSSYYLSQQGEHSWRPILLILVIWIAILWFAPIREPSQWWLYAVGILEFAAVSLAMSAVLLAIGPIPIRLLGGISILASFVFAVLVIFAGVSNYSLADQTLKRGNISTPQNTLRALNTSSRSVAIENGINGFQPAERVCDDADVMCAAVVQLYDVEKIKQTLGLLRAEWNFNHVNNVDVYQIQHRNLSIILAQGYGKTHITVADLSEIDEAEWPNLNFSAPTLGN